jgi:hypothetical protein
MVNIIGKRIYRPQGIKFYIIATRDRGGIVVNPGFGEIQADMA